MEKRITFPFAIVLIILIIIPISGCTYEDDNFEGKFSYSINISNSTNIPRYILLPVPIGSNQEVPSCINNLEIINGPGSFTIENNDRGPVINITIQSEIELLVVVTPKDIDKIYFASYSLENLSSRDNSISNYFSFVSYLTEDEMISIEIKGFWQSDTSSTLFVASGSILNYGWNPEVVGEITYAED